MALIVTYRDDEVAANPELERLLGDLATSRDVRPLILRPLSETAVRELAEPAGIDARGLSRVTGGPITRRSGAWSRSTRWSCSRPRDPDRGGLTYSHMGISSPQMARAATTADAFNAVAEPRRREILDLIADRERPVNELVERLGLAQPQVSKHLRVLREVGAVAVRDEGRRRMYRLNGRALKPIHDWVKNYEDTWSERFEALDVVLDELKQKEQDDGSSHR